MAEANAELPQLIMRLPLLDDIDVTVNGPPVEVAGPSDAAGIADLLRVAFDEPWDVAKVRSELGPSSGVEASYVVRDEGRIIAVASARQLPAYYPGMGYVHYVGAYEAFKGRGLGLAVTHAVLAHFRRAGLTGAVLETDDFRLPAIRTYLKLGFVPEYRHAADPGRWSRIFPLVMSTRSTGPQA